MGVLYLMLAAFVPLITLCASRVRPVAPLGGPLAIISLQLFLGVTTKTFYTYFDDGPHFQPQFLRSDDSFFLALIYLTSYAIAIALGYLWASSPSEQFRGRRLVTRQFLDGKFATVVLLTSIAAFAIVAFLYLERRAGRGGLSIAALPELLLGVMQSKVTPIEGESAFGSTQAFLSSFLVLLLAGFVMLYASMLSLPQKKSFRIGAYVCFTLLILAAVLRSKRDELAELMLVIVLITSFVRGGVSFRSKLSFAKYLSLFLLIFSTMTFVRGNTDTAVNLDQMSLTENIRRPLLESTYFTDINVVANIIEQMPRLGFMYGESYTRIFTSLVPRDFWPEKPAISLGLFVKSEIFGQRGTLGGVPPTMPGESYINFGWFGLLLGVVYGAALRRTEVFLLNEQTITHLGGFWLYVLVVVPMSWSMMQSSFALVGTDIISRVVITIPFLVVGARRARIRWREQG